MEMMDAFTPPGPPEMNPITRTRLANQVLDAVGLPGTSSPSADESTLSRLAEGIHSMATGGLAGEAAGGINLLDTGWQALKRNAIGNIKTKDDLQHRVETLHNQKEEILSQVITRLQMVFMSAGYSSDRAHQLACGSMYYRISRFNYEAYLNLHVTLLTQSSESGFDETKAYLEYHTRKLREPRGIYSVRLQMIAHHYIYFRDGQKKNWESLGIQRLRLRSLKAPKAPAGGGDNSSGDGPKDGGQKSRRCSHCHSGFHSGNKKNCFWKDLSPSEAKKAAKECAKNLGVGLVTDEKD